MLARLVVVALLLSTAARAAEPPCDADTPAGTTCACDVRTLHPLQGAVGMEEVRAKIAAIDAKPNKAWRGLQADPIKVVVGPGGALFITDHHHGADAWRLAGHPLALCQLGDTRTFATDAAFWDGLAADRLVRLADQDGNPLTPAQLPPSLERLPDDPYRSLAWRLRKSDGFCRATMPQKEFAEFIWADWMRTRPELPADAVKASAAHILPAAFALARGPEAKALPGYVGDKPADFECPDDP